MNDGDENYNIFRDCMLTAIAGKSVVNNKKITGRRRKSIKQQRGEIAAPGPVADPLKSPQHDKPAELAEFSDYVSQEIFTSLPDSLQSLAFRELLGNTILSDTYSLPLTLTTLESLADAVPPSVTDTLDSYGLINPPASDVTSFLSPILAAYISQISTPPPPPSSTRVSACEICDRDWVPLTYHHLIPKAVHARVLKRGWHDQSKLNNVAWLCRACHSFVHRVASNEELAKEWYAVDKLLERDDVQKWRSWVGRVRWKKR